MRWFIRIILILIVSLLAVGFYRQFFELPKAELIIGIAVLILAFVFIPAFIYQRYKNKNLKDYMLDGDKINKIFNNLKM